MSSKISGSFAWGILLQYVLKLGPFDLSEFYLSYIFIKVPIRCLNNDNIFNQDARSSICLFRIGLRLKFSTFSILFWCYSGNIRVIKTIPSRLVLLRFNLKFLTLSNSFNENECECEWTEKSVAEVLMRKLEDVTWIWKVIIRWMII